MMLGHHVPTAFQHSAGLPIIDASSPNFPVTGASDFTLIDVNNTLYHLREIPLFFLDLRFSLSL